MSPWVAAILCLLTHLPWAPTEPANRDGITFADGVLAYDVTEWRPHWPGYPVLILAGKAAALLTGDPFLALRLLSVLCTSVTAVLLGRLASSLAEQRGAPEIEALAVGGAAAILWVVLPVSTLDGTEMFSDPLALALTLGMVLVLARGEARWLPLAGLLGALVLGARLSYLFLLGPLPLVLLRQRDPAAARRGLAGLLVGCALWWSWQLAMDGFGWFKAGALFLEGFWGDWGGSSLTDPGAARRPTRLLYTFLRYPLGGWWPGLPTLRLVPTVFLALAGLVGARRAWSTPTGRLLAASTLPYLLWISFAHSVDLARYTMPFAAALVVIVANGLPRSFAQAAPVFAGTAAILASITAPLAVKHAQIAPMGIQAGRFLSANLDPRSTTILLSAPSPFLPRYAPGFATLILEDGQGAGPPWRAEAAVAEASAAGRTLVATRDILLGQRLSLEGWRPLVDLHQDPEVVSRGPWSLHLYVKHPRE